MARAANAGCWHCPFREDTAEHTLFACLRWNDLRDEWNDLWDKLRSHLGHPPSAEDLPDLLCGPDFVLLPEDVEARCNLLRDAEESFRLFYKLVENIMTLKEAEERATQAAGIGARQRP